MLALMKMGFNYSEITAMPESHAAQYLAAYNEMKSPSQGAKKYIIKRRKK